MSRTLYQIDRAIEEALAIALTENIDPETGEILSGDFSQLEELAVERTVKFENIGAYIKNLTAEAEAIKEEEKNLERRRKAKEKEIERLKGFVAYSMTNAGEDKFESPKVAFSFKKSKKVEVLNMEAIPEEYIRVTVKKDADKTAIGKLLKAGQEVPGCVLLENNNLQIK